MERPLPARTAEWKSPKRRRTAPPNEQNQALEENGRGERIRDRLFALGTESRRGFSRLPGLNPKELALMRAHETRGRALVEARQRHQQLEIRRLQVFGEAHPALWWAMATSRTPPPGVPKAVVTLFDRYRDYWGELVPSPPLATVVGPARAEGRETFQGKDHSEAAPRPPAGSEAAGKGPSRDPLIEAALDYVERRGALRSWAGDIWAVDVTALPREHRSVFERPELANYVQDSLEDMNYRLQRDFAAGQCRSAAGRTSTARINAAAAAKGRQ